jgi:small GTP-binding protein
MPRLSRVVIIGTPNVGKSTLTNQLVGWKISSVSQKVHTTRHKVIGVIVEDETQVEFLDTPGVVTRKHCAKHKLESTFISDPQTSVDVANIIAVVCDTSNQRERERLNPGILKLLQKHLNKESILILNKIDKIREKRKLLDITTRLTCGVVGGISSVKSIQRPLVNANRDSKKNLEKIFEKTERKQNFDLSEENNDENEEKIGWNRFSRVFMVSALNGDGIEDIRQYFLDRARFEPWIYHRSQVTDQSPHELLKTTLREKCLDLLRQEIPYKINFVITMWELDPMGNLYVAVDVLCPQRFQSLVIGPKGQNISALVRSTRESLSNTFHCEVSLKLIVKGTNYK